MSRIALIALLPVLWSAPAAAQPMDPNMPGMSMPAAKPAAKPKARKHPAKPPAANPHAEHDMSAMPGMNMPPPAPSAAPAGQGMAGMAMPEQPEAPIPQAPPPPAPRDHAADRDYDPASMAASRRVLRMEHGGGTAYQVMANIAEYQAGSGGGYRWEGQAWYGGAINRFVATSEGEGTRRDGLDSAELQVLYSRAVSPYVDLQAGVRQDFAPRARTYLTLGAQSLLPYWFDVQGAVFLSDKGEVLARLEGYYDLRLTQRLVLQPRAEINLAAQNSRQTATGSGLSDAALDLRLRYEIRHEFAPYIGVSYQRRFGKTADYARLAGENPESKNFVVGLRAWF
ncbi:MAG: copper resistance precursor [Phenylobacterium sp.]|nr:copper resistance precursor [Phenylobacterium sp.]